MTAIASIAFARLPLALTQTASRPATGAEDIAKPKQSVLAVPGLRVLFFALFLMGIVFGAAELMLVAFSQELGRESASSLLVAVFATGSVLGGLWYGWKHWALTLTRRLMITVTWFGLALIPMIFAHEIWMMALTVALTGLAISPSTIAMMTLTERITPPEMVTEGFAWLSSAISAGAACGTLTGGVLIDDFGSNGAQVLCVASGLAAAVVILGGRRWLQPPESVP
jgi:MFS family permease